MRQPDYLKSFNDKAAAVEWAMLKHRANRAAHWHWAVVEGPSDEEAWCVVDLDTAIELGAGYLLVR